jgi:copper chaperone NosL
MRGRIAFAPIVLLVACGGGALAPASLQAGLACSHCRMTIVDPRLAAQIVAPGEEPRFFDDIGCLARHLADHPAAADARAYVADHVSGAWVPANDAVYSRAASLDTPMGSHIIAHANARARDGDPQARGAERLEPRDVFGPGLAGGRGGR